MPWFEDFKVGDRHRFGHYEVTRDEVLDFARRWDPQPFHLSDDGAAATHFGSLSASGWHTAAMTMAMVVAEQGKDDDGSGSLGAVGIDNLRWLKPVKPGDVLSVETEVIETRPSSSRPEMGSIRNRTTVFDQHGDPVMRFEPIVLYRRRSA
ncbi:MaoC family dehydratase [Sphingomonas oryzagri]|uniref:MaoC family dehydratase n=1 Tax=Sphingomonas oryzagri TaxID=3042314 RepID=A0ABT6MWR5_9SPHN|nr:MaoC family dehydratase [Sphingomonas oryzagri]MDH7637493.1 MaoC family dehydratase [Sphingomonas oryzagri]